MQWPLPCFFAPRCRLNANLVRTENQWLVKPSSMLCVQDLLLKDLLYYRGRISTDGYLLSTFSDKGTTASTVITFYYYYYLYYLIYIIFIARTNMNLFLISQRYCTTLLFFKLYHVYSIGYITVDYFMGGRNTLRDFATRLWLEKVVTLCLLSRQNVLLALNLRVND